MRSIKTREARQRIAELLELAFYKNEQFVIQRDKRPMARLVGEPYMQKLEQFLEHLIEHEPALADTLAIMLNDDVREVIEKGTEEVAAGQTVPLESILDD